jgi:hypothetical protein
MIGSRAGRRSLRFVVQPPRRSRPGVFLTLIAAGLLSALALPSAASGANAPASAKGIRQWQAAIEKLRAPARGCFDARYPEIEWRRATCTKPPKTLFEPPPPAALAVSPEPQLVGGGGATDYAAGVATGVISSATGSFSSESANVTEQSGGTQNQYSLQLNTEHFPTSICDGGSAGCLGWVQFTYGSTSGDDDVDIQDWLLGYSSQPGGSCPTSPPGSPPWEPRTYYGETDCVMNNPGTPLMVAPQAGQLYQDMVTLTGTAAGGAGGMDTAVMAEGGMAVDNAMQYDDVLNLAGSWQDAEFNVFGGGGGTEAVFSPANASLGVALAVQTSTGTHPVCQIASYTDETNNLNLQPHPVLAGGPAPSMTFNETGSSGTPACSSGAGWGEVHLATFGCGSCSVPLTYNFQASGDFELAARAPEPSEGPPFSVEARLVPFAANPSLSVSRAVAAQIGPSQVAVCYADPLRLEINRHTVQLASGHTRGLPGGGAVSRQGDEYLIRDRSGDTLQAAPGSYLGVPYLNLGVGLARWPTAVSGLLANAGNSSDAIESRGGTVLTAPFRFGEFYKLYANSWRVPPKQDLLTACGTKFVSRTPIQNFEVNSLSPSLRRTAQAICVRARVRASAMLDACTLDVAVLGKGAAKIYATLPARVIWGKILSSRASGSTIRA